MSYVTQLQECQNELLDINEALSAYYSGTRQKMFMIRTATTQRQYEFSDMSNILSYLIQRKKELEGALPILAAACGLAPDKPLFNDRKTVPMVFNPTGGNINGRI